MKFSAKDQETLVQILARFYQEIHTIESEYALLIGRGDLRPRIEFFHDAVRALTQPQHHATGADRLSVERLAYDVQMLRYLSDKPLASFPGAAHTGPTQQQLVPTSPGLVPVARKPDREIREQLGELYRQYGVLFSALLKPAADRDYLDRSEALAEDASEIKQLTEALTQGGNEAETLVQHLNDTALQRELLAFLKKSKGKRSAALSGVLAKLKREIQDKTQSLQAVDKAHHTYATSQLGIYENAKDTLKKMAAHGMNLVGAFVEASIRNQQQGRDR